MMLSSYSNAVIFIPICSIPQRGMILIFALLSCFFNLLPPFFYLFSVLIFFFHDFLTIPAVPVELYLMIRYLKSHGIGNGLLQCIKEVSFK